MRSFELQFFRKEAVFTDKITVGKFIAEQRKLRSLTQKQFADKLGVTDKAVSRWETGKGYPDIETLVEIANVFNVSVNDILSGKINMPEEKESEADKNIIAVLYETQKEKLKGLKRLIITAVAFSFIICVIFPSLYLILIPEICYGNRVDYNGKHYNFIVEEYLPSGFVLYDSEAGYTGSVIGRDGVDLIRKTSSERTVYNSEILGRNSIYALFDEEDVPSATQAVEYGAKAMYYFGSENKIPLTDDTKKLIEYLNKIKQTAPISISAEEYGKYDSIYIRLDCPVFDGYYLVGDLIYKGDTSYFIPLEDSGKCYKVSLDELT
ncbi:MAG: helix-turn-helix transcriptional regulator [Ruminococcaceae bacterium]|nr:helix-turn-helix transcriptional regulator [Oscillospiraceae bacterium]